MEKIEKLLDQYLFIAVILISLPAVLALLVPGYFGASDDLHVAWLYEMDKIIKLGQIPPRFVPDLSYQFGYPLFNFVFPLPFYIGEIFHLLGLNLVDSVKTLFLITVPVSMYWMFKLLRQFSSTLVSLAGATLYVYTPYRATDLYVRGAIGEILGFALLPLVCLSLIKITQQKKVINQWLGIGALSIGALILTHDITAYMFLPFVAILGIGYLMVSTNKIQTLISMLTMGLFGLLVSLYFWLPAILDSKLMKYDTVFNFQDHFPTLIQLIKPYWGYGASVPGPFDGMSFFIGIFNWVGFLIGIPLLVIFWKKFNNLEKIIIGWGYGVFLIAIFMMNFRSTFIWQITPELPYFQFPWRLLILTTFTSCLFFLSLEKLKYAKQISLVLVVIIVATNAFQFRPHDFLGRNDQYYLNKYIPFPVASEDYKLTQEEYLRLPKDTISRPDKIYPELFSYNDVVIAKSPESKPFDIKGATTSNIESQVSINKYNFPGWQAFIDGKQVQVIPAPPFGQVSFKVPPGDHQVRISFNETPLKLALDLISLLSFGVAILLAASSYLNLRKKVHV